MDRKPYVLTTFETRRISKLRAGCPACNGNPDACMAGDDNQDRLQGCAAFTADGSVAPSRPEVKQPWQVDLAA